MDVMIMEGRINEETGIFEIVLNHNWVILNDETWSSAQKEISNGFLMTIFYKADDLYREKAFCELKRRIESNFNLELLWNVALNENRVLGDLALNEIFERSGRLLLSHYKNK